MKLKIVSLLFLLSGLAPAWAGVPIRYQLPVDGQTYRVTLAIVDAKNPDWIISQFACGVARTATAENGGQFEETWNGLDIITDRNCFSTARAVGSGRGL